MTQVSANFETGVLGNTVAAADAGSATQFDVVVIQGADTVTYDWAHVADGSLAVKFAGGGGVFTFLGWQSTHFGTVTNHYGRCYLYLTAYPSTGVVFAQCSKNGVGRAFRLDVLSTGQIATYDSPATGTFTTTNSIALNRLVRLEWHCVHSATVGQVEVRLFNSAGSTTPTETKTSPATWDTLADANEIFFGFVDSSGAALTYWMDAIVAGDTTYPTPLSIPVDSVQVLSMQTHVFGHGVW